MLCAVFFVILHLQRHTAMNTNLDATGHSQTVQEREVERALRPKGFNSFAGQKQVLDNLRIFVGAAKQRGEPLDHVLFFGPPGLGKTTLSYIIANELGVNIKMTSGPVLDKPFHRRDTPSVARSGGVPLLCHGGLQDRHTYRVRPCCP